ncbi:hypothetical protein DLAC_02317 [Tieghemostelium lacteum]|uniref:Uncharacterized protein n=1 Tax=Tieghemostelium lacteum TaxID=361077 RepID=A0A152A4N2_TIELA|nr:hypothetical protein DLAC_02317 [Tieghemostelium lacteum]|eukprot:KYR01200.1 hypothetical protein DLAC_02317 [Tieghemostelium lacteum]
MFINKYTLISKIWNKEIFPKLTLGWSIGFGTHFSKLMNQISLFTQTVKLLKSYRFNIGNCGLDYRFDGDLPQHALNTVRDIVRTITISYQNLDSIKEYTQLNRINIVHNGENQNIILPTHNDDKNSVTYHLNTKNSVALSTDIFKQPFTSLYLTCRISKPTSNLSTSIEYSNTIKQVDINQLIIEPSVLVNILQKLPSLEVLQIFYSTRRDINNDLIFMVFDCLSSVDVASPLNNLKKLNIQGSKTPMNNVIKLLNRTKCLDIEIVIFGYLLSNLDKELYEQTIDNTSTQSFKFHQVHPFSNIGKFDEHFSFFHIWKDSSKLKSITFSECTFKIHPLNKNPFENLKSFDFYLPGISNGFEEIIKPLLASAPNLEALEWRYDMEFEDFISLLNHKGKIRDLSVYSVILNDSDLTVQDISSLTNAIGNNSSLVNLDFQFDDCAPLTYEFFSILCDILSRNHNLVTLSIPTQSYNISSSLTSNQIEHIKTILSNNHTITKINNTSAELQDILKTFFINI